MSYIGRAPGFGIRNRYYYTATAAQTTFSGADDNGQTLAYADSKYLDVFLNGVLLVAGTDYTATTLTSVTLTSGASAADIIEIVAYDIFSVADTVSSASGGTFNGAVTFDGGANFGDNDKAIFGDGSDLEIYHDGSNSYIKDAGTGNLRLQGASYVVLESASGAGEMLSAASGGAVVLNHNNIQKLQTTTTGINVTGNAELSGSIIPNVAPSTAWAFDGANSTSANTFVTLANDATYNLAVGSGVVYAVEHSGAGACQYYCIFGSITANNFNASLFTNVVDNAGTINLSLVGGFYRFQNKTGSSKSLFITTIRLRNVV